MEDNDKAVLVTGVAGGIGSAIGYRLRQDGYFVVGLDRAVPDERTCDRYVEFDLLGSRNSDRFHGECLSPLCAAIGKRPLAGLINNAALQILAPTDQIELSSWEDSFLVNVTVPMLLVKAFLEPLRAANGCVTNIGSVHSQATKRGFVTYATTKSALHGLTRALAVDLGPDVRVVCLAPAAISTPMLMEGFEGKDSDFARLADCHPLDRIGSPDEVANAVAFLISEGAGFLTGATLYLDGGVLCRLHDPS